MNIQFDCVGAEGRQVLRRDEIRVFHHMELRRAEVQERRHMAPGDKMDFPHPGGVLFDAAEPVRQQPPVPLPVNGVAVLRRRRSGFTFLLQPGRIAAVHPEDDDVDVHK